MPKWWAISWTTVTHLGDDLLLGHADRQRRVAEDVMGSGSAIV